MSDLDPLAAGHDYSEGPPVEPYHGLAATRQYDDGGLVGFKDGRTTYRAMQTAAKIVQRLPFKGLVDRPMPSGGDSTPEDFLADLTYWLAGYEQIIASRADDFTRQARVIADMKNERAAVRAFFALPTEDC